jgi:hypothetical protein
MIKLLIFLQLKHFLIDFPLQSPYFTLNKGDIKHPALYLHALMHGVVTGFLLNPICGLLDFIVHGIIDFLKADYTISNKLTPQDKKFWNAFGIDQMCHQLIYLFLVWIHYGY